ncbi:MAG: hypothetical protein CMH83_13105 [Nocardioides sp.]|nr:hypothetical protein [Nocardioides sp.]
MGSARRIVEVSEYGGEGAVIIAATQLGSGYTERRKRQLVDEWVDFFAQGPSGIRALQFTTRTPKRLFDALRSQSQLVTLDIKWGDYHDLSTLATMTDLRSLRLKGASKVKDLAPLGVLQSVETLHVEGLQGVVDAEPVAAMRSVTDLELGGNWVTPKIVRLPSIAFLARMPQLKRLLLHTLLVQDLDFSPLLDLPNLEWVRVMETRGMKPSRDHLMSQLPWVG